MYFRKQKRTFYERTINMDGEKKKVITNVFVTGLVFSIYLILPHSIVHCLWGMLMEIRISLDLF